MPLLAEGHSKPLELGEACIGSPSGSEGTGPALTGFQTLGLQNPEVIGFCWVSHQVVELSHGSPRELARCLITAEHGTAQPGLYLEQALTGNICC